MVEIEGTTQKEVNQKKLQKVGSWDWVSWVIIGYLLFAYFLNIFPFQRGYEVTCTDECISDMDFCMSNSGQYVGGMEKIYSSLDYDDCYYDLENCVSDCGGG